MRMMEKAYRIVVILAVLMLTTQASAAPKPATQPVGEEQADEKTVKSWVKPVPGFVPVQPGEHPRILFRKSDLPALRERAKTKEGQEIIARLRATLGGGEALPTIRNPATQSYSPESSSDPELRKEGAYTVSHAAGFGFLYQLTGEQKYADLARGCVELAYKGQRDRDDRYSLLGYGNDAQLRAAPTLAMYALAYDLCYEAWPEDFRRGLAEKLFTANADLKIKTDLRTMVNKPNHMPSSNHWGAEIGGVAITLLALNGDPGVDQKFIDASLPKVEENLVKTFARAWGDGGWFSESTGPSHVSSNSAVMPALLAFKNAAGKDYTDYPNVTWMTMRWAYDIFPKDGKPYYPARLIGGNVSYGTEDFLGNSKGGGFSHGGWFAEGFGVIPEDKKPALLWTYQNFVAKAMGDDYDIRNYPHRAILSFINWPIGMKPVNPGEVLSKVRYDSIHGYVSFRNQWKDEDDILVTAWTNSGPRGWMGRKGPHMPGYDHGDVILWAYGRETKLGAMHTGEPKVVWSNPDGSGSFTNGQKQFAVDFSRRAGVDALIVGLGVGGGGADARIWSMTSPETIVDGKRLSVVSLSKSGMHPIPKADKANKRFIIGGQTVALVDGNIVFKPLDGVEPGMGAKTLDANVALAELKLKAAEKAKLDDVPAAEIVAPKDPPAFSFSFEALETEGDKQLFRDVGPNKLAAFVKGAKVRVEPGAVGNAVLLNGLDNVLVVPPNAAIDAAGKSQTLLAWFKNETSEPGFEWVILEKNIWQRSKAPDCYSICVDSAGQFGYNTPNATGFSRPELPWSDGQWHHVASVFDAQNKTIALYIDGTIVNKVKPLKGTCQIGEGSAPLTIGARGSVKPTNMFGGWLDEVAMYDRPLTRGEIRALYLQGKPAGEAEPAKDR